MKFKLLILPLLLPAIANAASTSVFSTSVDWEAVTGMRLHQTLVKFIPDSKIIENGLELYFLDGFPCFAQTGKARIWIGQKNTEDEIILTCAHVPDTVNFAWRNADRDAPQAKTTGILKCSVSGENNIIIDLSKCEIGTSWDEYK